MLLPKFKNQQEYDKAELLMQPIFIRVLDNIRQQSESLNWNVSYEETQEPFPGYIVCLSKDNYEVKKNIWQLCFEICFINYSDSQN